ncbi:hypothetical protein QM012_007900 [Aureobasidium pullulans]|uniref:Uncharacterized protein n=1 Tax=Aureobasidium pullulans TaxID=5580 RepID=A0ABR0TMI9_AURPU
MHVIKTIAAAFALAVTVSALPLQKRQAVGDPDSPLDDLLTNIQGGTEGFEDFLSIPSGDGDNSKVKRAEDIPDAANPVVDLAENVKGGFEGFFDFLGASGSDDE